MLNRLHCFQVLESKEKQDQSTAVRPEDVVQEFKLRTPFRKSDQYAHSPHTAHDLPCLDTCLQLDYFTCACEFAHLLYIPSNFTNA